MLNIVLLTGGILLHACIAFVLWKRRFNTQFPFFFAYNVYSLLGTTARLVVSSDSYLYFYVFWWTDLGFLLLGIASVHEGFRSVFEGFYLLRWFRWSYFGAIGIVVCIAIVHSIFNRTEHLYPVFRIVLDLQIPINCIQAAIFGLFYLCVKLFNVSFRRYPFAIVLGFGISAIGTLVPLVALSDFGKSFGSFALYAPAVAYYITLLVWFSAFLRPEPEEDEKVPPLSPQQMADEVTQYTRVLKGFFGKSHEF
ncbi:MAG TPA: hypothetical protein VJA94_16430 [Candidatus Angelobacter sp.]